MIACSQALGWAELDEAEKKAAKSLGFDRRSWESARGDGAAKESGF